MRFAFKIIILATVAAASQLTVAVSAQATTTTAAAAPASLRMHSDPGDFIGQGKDYSYVQPRDQFFANAGFNHNTIFATVNGLNGDHWTLQFAAPDSQPLQVGSYPNAQGAPSQQAGHPGIQVDQGFSCQTITGQFDVLDIEFAANGTVSRLDITFTEQCNGATAALSGELIFTPPSGLPPLSLNVGVHPTATLDNTAATITVRGIVTCTQFVWTMVQADVTQNNGVDFTTGFVNVSCRPGRAAKWTIVMNSSGSSFQLGTANASAFASGEDAGNGTIADSPSANTTVTLVPADT